MKKILNLNDKLLILILILILGFFLFFLSNFINLDTYSLKHWSKNADDIVFPYNSLLYAQGLEQEHLDHPSLFTFLIFPIFYKLFYFLNYLSFYDLEGFISQPNVDDSLNKLFFVSQIAIFVFSSILIAFFFKISKKFSGRSFDAFYLSIILMISTGFLNESTRVESSLIATTFLLISYFCLIKFFESESKKSFFYFALLILFILSSMMQKKLVYCTIPFFFFSSIYFIKNNNNNLIRIKYLDAKYYLLILYLAVFAVIFLKTFKPGRDLDFLFLIINYFGLNILLFLYVRNFQNKNYDNLLIYNIIFGSIYFLYKFILLNFFSAHIAIWSVSFTNWMGQINMFTTGPVKGAFDFGSLSTYYDFFILNFKLMFIKYFFTFSYQSVLIWTNISLVLYFFKKITKKEIISIFFLIFGFIFFQTACNFRYEDPTYYIFSEFLLLLSLSILLKNFKINIKYLLFLFFVSILIGYSNLKTVNEIIVANKGNSCKWVLEEIKKEPTSFYIYYANKIPKKTRLKFCQKY